MLDADHRGRVWEPSEGSHLNRRPSQSATLTSPIMTGTSTSGPITAAKAAPWLMVKVATATAMASSKLFEAAVNDSVVAWP